MWFIQFTQWELELELMPPDNQASSPDKERGQVRSTAYSNARPHLKSPQVSKLTCYSISEREKLRTPSQVFSDSHTPLDPDPCFQILCFGIHPVSLQVETHSSGWWTVPLSQNLVTGETIAGSWLGLIQMQLQSPGPARGQLLSEWSVFGNSGVYCAKWDVLIMYLWLSLCASLVVTDSL